MSEYFCLKCGKTTTEPITPEEMSTLCKCPNCRSVGSLIVDGREYIHIEALKSFLCKDLRARIAELEAAQQWHDASEPPENMQRVQIKTDGHIMNGIYVHSVVGYAVTFCDQRYIIARIAVDGWRDLPPMPEVDT